jgi:hypothetical protein
MREAFRKPRPWTCRPALGGNWAGRIGENRNERVGGWAGTGDGGWGENDCVVCFYYSVGAGLRRKGAKRGSFDLHLTLDKGLDIS